ncbi:sugar transferase [Micromonospora antibiotica]|uniref:Sugar transferase n=1 Tax=Micromonospora antibiotica TaxID=2807623 RepID=A0ABS3VCT0_9ACTN|nr:sugar transferase [Micromonospora antibiotica]MBO4163433.1 sugar transferase [Micromonospora antibiotica]
MPKVAVHTAPPRAGADGRGATPTHRRPYDRWKRLFDVLGALVVLTVGAPLLALVALVVLVTHGRPVLFRHTRPGLHGELFDVVKFRTMLHPDPDRGLVTDAQRLTRVGRWLRASSLDELPEFWNVLRGEMSVVGPRPHLVRYLDLYNAEQARRHEVRPGITGLAQVRGRNALSWEAKFGYDVEYVDRRSFLLDLKILLTTVRVVLTREGISAPGAATWHEFTGNAPAPASAPTDDRANASAPADARTDASAPTYARPDASSPADTRTDASSPVYVQPVDGPGPVSSPVDDRDAAYRR